MILENEMTWTQLWFQHQIQLWEERKTLAAESLSDGHVVYAAKQVWIWKTFWDDSKYSFQNVLSTKKL
jgi:hypothetical protein